MIRQSGPKARARLGFLVALLTLALSAPGALDTPRVAHAAPAGCSVSGEAYGTQTTGNARVASGKTADIILPPGGTNSVGATTSPAVSTGPITDTSLDVSIPTLATAASTSTVTGVSILAGVVTGSFQSVSTSNSDGATASNASAGTYQSYSINNGPTQMNPAPNTRVDVPGIGFAIVNEQTPTGNGTTTTGLTVIGFDLHVVTGTAVIPAGTEVVIASATSGVACGSLLAPLATGTAAAQTASAGATQTASAGAAQTASAGAAQTAAAQTASAGAAQTAAGVAQTAAAPTATAGTTGTGRAVNTAAPPATRTPASRNGAPAATATTSAAPAAATGTARASTQATPTPGQTGPSLTLQPPSAGPGGTVTVTGRGFGRREGVTVSLNGTALTAVVTHPDGTFTATFRAPDGLLRGTNTVAAIGATSGRGAVATLTGRQRVASAFYFAGASTMPGEQARLPILNPNARLAHVTLTFFYRDGTPRGTRLTVPAHSRGTANLNTLAGSNRAFGVTLTADQVVAAQVSITRRGQDDVSLLGVSAPSSTWYLAEGYTGLTFHETLALLNPGRARAVVQLRLLTFAGKATRTVTVVVAPQRALLVDVNRLLPGRSLSAIATSYTPIVVARLLTFSTHGYGETARVGSNTPARSWLFAEGTTTTRFETFLTILNPNHAGTSVTVRFYGRMGALQARRTMYVPGLRRANLKLNDVLHASGVASVVTGNLPIVVERPEYFGSPNGRTIAGSDVFGRNGAGLRWAFPGGTTDGRSEFLLIYNPSARTVAIDVTSYGSTGRMTTRRFDVAPTSRGTIDVNRRFRGVTAQHGFVLHAVNGLGFVAEQTVFAPNFSTLDSTQGVAS